MSFWHLDAAVSLLTNQRNAQKVAVGGVWSRQSTADFPVAAVTFDQNCLMDRLWRHNKKIHGFSILVSYIGSVDLETIAPRYMCTCLVRHRTGIN